MADRKIDARYALPLDFSRQWHGMKGEVPVRLTNDYLFRALMQSDNQTLIELIAALLHKDAREIVSAEITNPILLGDSIADKYYVLDIRVLLNGDTSLNLEMQVIKAADWIERSLGYLCRVYDTLNKGQAYIEAHMAIQIGLLDFTLFPEEPEFYATYKLMNIKTRRVYTEKFRLSCVDLTRIDLATDDDRKHKIDKWAQMFKAKTWEELAMVAHENQAIDRAVAGIYQLTEDELIREQCRQREEFQIMQQMEKKRLEMRDQKIREMGEIIVEKESEIAEKENELAEKENRIAEQEDKLTEQERLIADLRAELARLKQY